MKKFFGLLVLLFPLLAIAQAQEVFVSKEPAKRKAVIEEYTGVRCGNCPSGHKAEANLLKKYPGQLFAVNIHAGSYATPIGNDPDLKVSDGIALESSFKISGYPAAILNRHKFGTSYEMKVSSSFESDWENYMRQIFTMDSYVNIAAKGELDWATRKLKLTVQLYYTGEVSGTTSNRIHVAMTQDEIIAKQEDYKDYNPDQVTQDGRYLHLHVLRDMLTPLDGDVVTSIGKDSLVTRTYEWDLPESIENIPLDLLNTNFVVFVAESKYEIFSACEPELKDINAPETVVKISDVKTQPSYSCDLAGKASFTLTNKVGKDITDVTFSIQTSWGNTEYTYKADSVLKARQSVSILTDAFAARTNAEETVEIKVKAVNGEAYAADSLSTATTTLFANYASTHNADVTLNIVQDRYGSDITWKFRDTEKDTILYTGGPYKDFNSNRTQINSVPMNLEKGCYVLTVYDAKKDGINNNYGAGNINFVSQGQEFYRHDGKYADSVLIMLDTREGAANGKTEKAETLTLRPNPAKDRAEISFTAEKTAMVRVQVLNHTGACVLDLGNIRTEAGNTRIELPLQNLVPGMYFVVLRGENINLSSKLVVVR